VARQFGSVVSTPNHAGRNQQEKEFTVNLENIETINGTMPTDTASVQSKQSTTEVKLYEVSVGAEIQMNLVGSVKVYAVDADEAFEKVQAHIDNETLDDDLEMEDVDSGNTMSYGDLRYHAINIDIDEGSIEVVEDNVDLADVLEVEVEQLEVSISWNTDALAKHKAFLESLLNDDDSKLVVAA
jgi:hypothetical protein